MALKVGYGEDALTYYILKNKLGEVLSKLSDLSDEKDCCLFYRPSFGRGGRSQALLGEFDAILISPEYLYLIESKWTGSPELKKGEIQYRQVRRHKMVKWIAERWDGSKPIEQFSDLKKGFDTEFHGKQLASPYDEVCKNLHFILKKTIEINKHSKINIRNVLLIAVVEGFDTTIMDGIEEFEPITFNYVPIDGTNFFIMDE